MTISTQIAQLQSIAHEYGIYIRNYDVTANKPSVVFVHGIGVSGEYFAPLAKIMNGRYSTLSLDLPGYGNSPNPKKTYTPKELGDILGQFLTEAGLLDSILLGHSMGCQIATRTAIIHPATCAKLILIGPTVNSQERSILKQGLRLLQDSFYETLESNLVIFRNYLKMGPISYIRTARYMVNDHLEKYIRDVKQPVLLARGANDKIAPLYWLEELSSKLTSATTLEIEGTPHAVHYIKPDETKRQCQRFIES